MRRVISRNRFVRASDLRFRSEWPVLAPFSFVFIRVRFIRVGKTASLLPWPDMMLVLEPAGDVLVDNRLRL
jgi:hypothetical protein